jgi:hypothetical protein
MIIFDSDDQGADFIISDMCQSHDARKTLDKLHYVNNNFKATLFAIPAQVTYEMAEWFKANNSWCELAVHGFGHTSNYECDKMTYEEMGEHVKQLQPMLDEYFVKGFKSPGWQTSDGVYKWLLDNGWWVASQSYDDSRRPEGLSSYVVGGNSIHSHTWSCMGNGIDEIYDEIVEKIKDETEFRFVSEAVNG